MVREKPAPASCIMFLKDKQKRRGTKQLRVKFPNTVGGYRPLEVGPKIRIDHNKVCVFPAQKDKTRQSRTEGNCLQLSMLAALRGLRKRLPHATYLDVQEQCAEHFDAVIAAAGHDGRHYGSKEDGYKPGDLVDFVRYLSSEVLHRVGLHLRMRKMQKPGYRWLFNQTVGKRKGRVFVCFGFAPGTLKKPPLLEKLDCCLNHGVCVPYIYGDEFMSKEFWAGTRDHWQPHAICVKYDSFGRGVVDDPAMATYRPLEIVSLMTCLPSIFAMYEISVTVKSDKN